MSQLFTWIDNAAPTQLALLKQIASIDSGTYDKEGVDAVGRILQAELESLGFAVERHPQTAVGDHLCGYKAGTGKTEILFVGHMDTVYSKGTLAARPWRVEGDRVYAPGAYDMKGGLCTALYALKALKAEDPQTWERLGIRVVFNTDEETGSDTSKALIAREAGKAALACVLEPARSEGEYVRDRKGVGNFVLTVKGKAAHAGAQPHLGANAITDLAIKVAKLHALNDQSTGLTVNVGTIRGGERTNVVPDFAECAIDIRVTSIAMMETVQARMKEIAAEVAIPGTQATLTGDFKHAPMEYTPAMEQLFVYLTQAGKEVGYEVTKVSTGGGSDGNTTSQYTPTMDGMGPRGNGAHSVNEYVAIDSLPERTKALARFVQLWSAAQEK
jgi:glutamate carboxypeptidase